MFHQVWWFVYCMIVLGVKFQVRGYTINSLFCLKFNKFKVIVQTRMMSNWQKLGTTFSQKQTFFCKLSEKVKISNPSGISEKERSRKKWDTIFPHIVSAETILFWIWPYVLWPLITVHKCAETIQGRKLYEEIRHSQFFWAYFFFFVY